MGTSPKEKNDGKAIARRALVHQDFTELEERAEADIEIDKLLLATPPEFRSYIRHWMESNAKQSMEEFLKLMKLEVGAILVNQLLSGQKKEDHKKGLFEKKLSQIMQTSN